MREKDLYQETRAEVLAAMLPPAAMDGWTPKTLDAAIVAAGIDADMALLAFPKGIGDVLAHYSADGDARMLAALPDPEGMRIRDRISEAVMVRLRVDGDHREAARRAAAYLSVPGRQKLAAKLLFETANQIWRWAGDEATDFNYYSKRLILSGVLVATRFVWFNDESDDFAETKAFLARRIDNVMQFEKLKTRLREVNQRANPLSEAVKNLAKMRYRDSATQ